MTWLAMPDNATKNLHCLRLGLLLSPVLLSACVEKVENTEDTKAVTVSRKLNDTGITWGGNYPKGINADCTAQVTEPQRVGDEQLNGDILAQQDCAHGGDADSGGEPAFALRKVDNDGNILPPQAQRWRCVIDDISGLMWEVKHEADGQYGNSGLHDGDDLFTWYNSNDRENGGHIGDWNSEGAQCSGYLAGQPKTYCHVEQFASRVNRQGLCSFADWRLPSRAELTTLIHFGHTEPAIHREFFPATQSDFYWSSSAVAHRPQEAWAVSFQFGFTTPMRRSDRRYARLVRTVNNDTP